MYIKLFDNFEPNKDDVFEILFFLEEKFKIKSMDILGKETKYVVVDYKPIYISGTFSNKKLAINKIFLEVKDELKEYSESSIRKAIRDFINI
jgi:hypothetical protein